MEFLYAASLAIFLSVPVGPVGFAAGEQMIRGNFRSFALIGLGCIVAEMVLALLALLVIQLAPTFNPDQMYRLGWVWVAVGALMVALGVYLWRHLPNAKAEPFEHPFPFGFVGTFFWPTSFAGIAGAFLAGWLPESFAQQLPLAPSLGIGTTVIWLEYSAQPEAHAASCRQKEYRQFPVRAAAAPYPFRRRHLLRYRPSTTTTAFC